jgi:hypothetical protein
MRILDVKMGRVDNASGASFAYQSGYHAEAPVIQIADLLVSLSIVTVKRPDNDATIPQMLKERAEVNGNAPVWWWQRSK